MWLRDAVRSEFTAVPKNGIDRFEAQGNLDATMHPGLVNVFSIFGKNRPFLKIWLHFSAKRLISDYKVWQIRVLLLTKVLFRAIMTCDIFPASRLRNWFRQIHAIWRQNDIAARPASGR